MGRLARIVLGIPAREVRAAERALGPEGGPLRDRFLALGESFQEGYHAALADPRPEPLAARLAAVERELQGFACEGAGMGLTMLDLLTPGRPRRFAAFAAGAGSPQIYMLHAGAGWALARLPIAPRRLVDRLDPLYRWMVLDGLGFHYAFFHRAAAIERGEVPARIFGYARRPFDVGVGRSLWFFERTDPGRIARSLARFPRERRGELWSGLGEAAAYAGGGERPALEELRRAAGPWLPSFAQGVSFSAETRERAGNPAPHTELACRVVWGAGAAEVAAAVRASAAGLPPDGEVPAFEVWKRRIGERLADFSGARRRAGAGGGPPAAEPVSGPCAPASPSGRERSRS